jgi:hypothetical protein
VVHLGQMWIGLAILLMAQALPAADAEPGFQPLFNGRDLEGWQLVKGKGPGYVAQDGMLVCPADGGGNLFTVKEYANFVLRLEFRLREGSNNGIGIRSPLAGDVAYSGMEIQVIDNDGPTYRGKLKPWQVHGSIYHVFPARTGYLRATGEWNEQEIIADGRRITVTLNGTKILDADLGSVRDPELLAKHPGLSRTSGHIGFLGHGTHVDFRRIRVKELP